MDAEFEAQLILFNKQQLTYQQFYDFVEPHGQGRFNPENVPMLYKFYKLAREMGFRVRFRSDLGDRAIWDLSTSYDEFYQALRLIEVEATKERTK